MYANGNVLMTRASYIEFTKQYLGLIHFQEMVDLPTLADRIEEHYNLTDPRHLIAYETLKEYPHIIIFRTKGGFEISNNTVPK